jgi:hypothetical protein
MPHDAHSCQNVGRLTTHFFGKSAALISIATFSDSFRCVLFATAVDKPWVFYPPVS